MNRAWLCGAVITAFVACGSDAAGPASNPVPVIVSLDPAFAVFGNASLHLFVHGTGFVADSKVRWNGSDVTTGFVNATELGVTVSATLLTHAETTSVTVVNPPPGGGTSPPSLFELRYSVPTVTTIAPTAVLAGDSSFPLLVSGTGFYPVSIVQVGGANLATTSINASTLTATVPAALFDVGGAYAVTVTNPAPGGGTSGSLALTAANQVATIQTVTPPGIVFGSPGATIHVTGARFAPAAIVQWNGVNLPTTYLSHTQLDATLVASQLTAVQTGPLVVVNPPPGGGPSASHTFAVGNPVPTITSMTPSAINAGDTTFQLAVDGIGFLASTTVRLNGAGLPTQPGSATHLTATVDSFMVRSGMTARITVFNPAPLGGSSDTLPLTVNNPIPVITAPTPDTLPAYPAVPILTLDGTGFVPASVILLDTVAKPTQYVSPTRLVATLHPLDVDGGGSRQIRVRNSPPAGGTTPALTMTVRNAVPDLVTVAPAAVRTFAPAFTLTASGFGFTAGSVLRWNGSDLPTTFVDTRTLTAAVAASLVSQPASAAITVFNQAPGGGLSIAQPVVIQNAPPVLTSLSPDSAAVGGSGLTVTVTGSGFTPATLVRFNGVPRTTMFASTTQLTASLTSADLAAVGVGTVTIASPPPGGGVSTGAPFRVGPRGATPTITSQIVLSAYQAIDMVHDSARTRLYAAALNTTGVNGHPNSIVAVDPSTGALTASAGFLEVPSRIAMSDDGQFLYVGFVNTSVVRRYLLPTLTLDLAIALPQVAGSLQAEALAVQPGAPHTVAVALKNWGVSAYDDSVPRGASSPGIAGDPSSRLITFSATPSVLYGLNTYSDFGFRQLTVDAAGVHEAAVSMNLGSMAGVFDMQFAGGRTFLSNGMVVEPTTVNLLGVCAADGPMRPEIGKGLVWILNRATSEITACDLSSHVTSARLTVPAGTQATTLVRWGADGFAYATGSSIVLIRTTMVP